MGGKAIGRCEEDGEPVECGWDECRELKEFEVRTRLIPPMYLISTLFVSGVTRYVKCPPRSFKT